MDKRIRVGLIYQYSENWIGGTYYIQNLVQALRSLPDELKPELNVITSTENEFQQINQLSYPYTKWTPPAKENKLSIPQRIINKIYNKLNGYDLYYSDRGINTASVDVLFPSYIGIANGVKKIYWIADLQEHALPQFFTKRELGNRLQINKYIANSKDEVVFSSQNAMEMFSDIFPKATVKKHVIHFAVTHPNGYGDLNINVLRDKFKLDQPYFFVPNQFWKHKNHLVVLKAIEKLRAEGIKNFLVVFTGKEHDYRNPAYTDEIKKYVADHKLEDHVRFLGFIDRKEQLRLMTGAIAVIQPSLFEGWSTVVEDAKAMGQYVIASNIPVHKEQLSENVSFFDPIDNSHLSSFMKEGIQNGFIKKPGHYDDYIRRFANDFISILQ